MGEESGAGGNFERLVLLVPAILLVAALGVWVQSQNFGLSERSSVTLRFSYNSFAGSLPPLLAQDLGYFQTGPCQVFLIREDQDQTAASNFVVGKSDGLATPLGTAVAHSGAAQPFNVVYVKDESLGADVLLASPQIGSVQELRGKKVGTVAGDFSEVWIEQVLARAGLTLEDIDIINVTGSDVVERIHSGELAAGHTWSPFKEEGEGAGFKVIASTMDYPRGILDVVIFKKRFMDSNRECVKFFLSGWSRAVDFWHSNPDSAVSRLSRLVGGSGVTADSLNGIKLYNIREQQNLWHDGSLGAQTEIYVSSFLRKGNLIPRHATESLLDGSLITELDKEPSL